MKRNKIVELLASLGLLLIAAGIMLPLFMGLDFTPFRYIYAAGAAIALIARLIGVNAPAGEPTRLRRMRRLEKWSAIFFCAGAFFLFYDHGTVRDALAFTLAGGVVQAMCSIMIPRLEAQWKAGKK